MLIAWVVSGGIFLLSCSFLFGVAIRHRHVKRIALEKAEREDFVLAMVAEILDDEHREALRLGLPEFEGPIPEHEDDWFFS